jgi:predicted nucleic acid-binding protein
MRVLVDTSVWSLALRRRQGALSAGEAGRVALLRRLIDEYRVMMVGPVRQELLSGIRDRAQFERLRDRLRAFPDERLEEADYEEAAAMGNACRSEGLATSAIDLLLCAATVRREAAIMTTDADFDRYATVLPLRLIRD